MCVFCSIRSQTPALANGDAQDQSKMDNEQNVSRKQSTQKCSGTHKTNTKPEEEESLVTLSDIKSMHTYMKSA